MRSLKFILFLSIGSCWGQTTFDKRYIVDIVSIEPIDILPTDLDAPERDSIREEYSNWHAGYKALEKYLLEIDNPGVFRGSNGNLVVELLNGSKLELVPDDMNEEVDFTFEHYFKEQALLVFRVQWYEGNNYAVVDKVTGKKTYMFGLPVLSKNNKFLISSNSDLEAGYSDNGFQLFEISNRELNKVWEFKPEGWGPIAVNWLDNSNIASKNIKLAPDGKTMIDYKKIVIKLKER